MNRGKKVFSVLSIYFIIFFVAVQNIHAEDIYISKSGADTNPGTIDQPFKTISKGLSISEPGDTAYVRTGTYNEYITFPTAGTAGNRITLKAYNSEPVTVTQTGQVMRIEKPYITVEDLIFDGNWGENDTVNLRPEADYCILRGLEIRNSRKDTLDIGGNLEGVLVENCFIHDAIRFVDGVRDDAHGIVTENVQNLTIRNTEIYYVSGDTLQFQYGWNNITVEGCVLWNGPLPSARGGAPKGVYPGENAVDTKNYLVDDRAKLVIKNTVAYGWHSDYINNASAFNIKQNVDVEFDRVTVYDSEIAFRLRGPDPDGVRGGALVTLKNAVIYNSDKGIRYEDKIEKLHIFNSTFGNGLPIIFENAGGYEPGGFELKNCLFLSASKPSEASDPSNMAVDATAFVNSASDNYHLASGSPAIDKGVTIAEVTTDRDGLSRPAGDAYDIGAYESEGGSASTDSPCDVEPHGNITLCVVINTLRICSGLTVDKKYLLDIDNDKKINLADAIYSLQALAKVRD